MGQYLRNVLIAFDQFANAILGGWPDETISSRLGRADNRFSAWLCGLLDRLDPRHCAKAVAAERDEAQEPPELRD